MPAWKLLLLAYKARRGWKRIPPERRKKIMVGVGKQVRKGGPVVAKRVGTALRNARKAP